MCGVANPVSYVLSRNVQSHITLLCAWVEQNVCYDFHKCSTSELTLSTLNSAQNLTLAPVKIVCIHLPWRAEYGPKPVMWDL